MKKLKEFCDEYGLTLEVEEVIDDEKEAGTITYQSRPAGSIIAERVNLKIKVTKKSETEAGSDHTNTDDGMVPYEEGNNN